MKKKILALLLCAAMTASVLTGCGRNADSADNSESTSEQEEQGTENSTGGVIQPRRK